MVMLSPGCCICTCDIDFRARISGCMDGLRDILVEFVDPDDPDTVFWAGNTIPTGEVSGTIEDIPAPGRKFKMRVTLPDLGKDRFVDPSHGVALYCGNANLIDYSSNGTHLVPADGYHCLPYYEGIYAGIPPWGHVVPGTATTDCNYPIPDELTLTDSRYSDAVTLTFTGSKEFPFWTGWARHTDEGGVFRIGYILGIMRDGFGGSTLFSIAKKYEVPSWDPEWGPPPPPDHSDTFPNTPPTLMGYKINSCLPFDMASGHHAYGFPEFDITVTEKPKT